MSEMLTDMLDIYHPWIVTSKQVINLGFPSLTSPQRPLTAECPMWKKESCSSGAGQREADSKENGKELLTLKTHLQEY